MPSKFGKMPSKFGIIKQIIEHRVGERCSWKIKQPKNIETGKNVVCHLETRWVRLS